MVSSRPSLLIITVIFAIVITRYFMTIHVPGPMEHPLKYRIISGSFAMTLDITHLLEFLTGIPYYTIINTIIDSFDPIKIRSFDHGEVSYHDHYIENVLVRIYTPTNASTSSLIPVIIFFHGGGFFFGSIYSHDTMTFHLSKYTGVKVIAVNYRLTPNVHYPTPIQENVKVAKYVIDNYKEFSIDPTRVFLCGDSAGGGLAVTVERHLRRDKKPIIRGVLLFYPLLQLVHFRLSSYLTYLPYRLLSLLREEILTQVANFYLNTTFYHGDLFRNRHMSLHDYEKFYSVMNLKNIKNNLEREYEISSISSHPDTWKLFDENVSPLLANDEILLNTPSTFIVACTYDVLLSDAQLYFSRLQQLNVKNVIYREYRIFHGVMTFVDFPVAFNEAFDIINDSAQFVVNRTTVVE